MRWFTLSPLRLSRKSKAGAAPGVHQECTTVLTEGTPSHNCTHRGHTLTQLTINGLGTLGVRGWAGCMGVDEDRPCSLIRAPHPVVIETWYLCIGLEVSGEELLDFSSDKVVSPRVQLEQAMHKLQEGAQEVMCGVCEGEGVRGCTWWRWVRMQMVTPCTGAFLVEVRQRQASTSRGSRQRLSDYGKTSGRR